MRVDKFLSVIATREQELKREMSSFIAPLPQLYLLNQIEFVKVLQ